jgi:hypothetical protein
MKGFITGFLATIAIGVFLIALVLAAHEVKKFLRRHLGVHRHPDQDN